MKLRTALAVVASLAAALPSVSAAQTFNSTTIYKSVGADGRVTYGDEPVPNARRVERLEFQRAPEPSASAGSSSAGSNRAPVVPATSPLVLQAEERMRALERADFEIRAAAQEVERAERRLAEAQEPQAGERTGLANGFSRPNDAYAFRIGMLQEQLDRAKTRLERAYATRNELRG